LAIKIISASHGQTIFDRIEDGAQQIDAPQCPADAGLIVINTKNPLRRQELWDADFPDQASAQAALKAQLMELIRRAERDRPQAEWEGLFTGRAVRPILFMGQSVVRLPTSVGGPQTPTPLKMLLAHDARGVMEPQAKAIAYLLNEQMQRILRGIPGGPGQPPQ